MKKKNFVIIGMILVGAGILSLNLKCTHVIKANTISQQTYTLWQGNGDAYRHAYWSALMTKKIDRDFAYDVGLAHEGLKSGYNFDKQNADTKMDISNNYSGRKIGTSNSSKSDSTISSVVKSNCSNGKLKRIRTYTSSAAKNDKIINGVMTNYVGYYVATTSGGLK